MRALLFVLALAAQPAFADEPPVLRVGAAGEAPFVLEKDGVTRGLAVDIWAEAARRLDVPFEVVRVASVQEALRAVEEGRLDVAVGPLSITSDRAQKLSFTQPWYRADLAILAPVEPPSAFSHLAPLASDAFLWSLGVLFAVLAVVGTLVWLAERRRNPEHFPAEPVRGIANGVWFSLVTMTTVGYGDRAPVTGIGRAVAGVWMVGAMLTASSLTAGLATVFTLSQMPQAQVTSAEGLRGRVVATVEGSTGARFAKRFGARLSLAPTLDEAIERVAAGKADAAVFDRPGLRWALSEEPNDAVEIAEASYEPQRYGFALAWGSGLRDRLDAVLLALDEEGRIEELSSKWFGP